jgi:uncharacterized membrane protein
MNIDPLIDLFLITMLVATGWYATWVWGRHTSKFRWSEYFMYIAGPLIAVGLIAIKHGTEVYTLFIISACVGFTVEYVLASTWHAVQSERLWHYKKYSLKGYASYVLIPLWGVAGVSYYLLAKLLGL